MSEIFTQQDILLNSAINKIEYLKDNFAVQMGEARENLLNAIKEYVAFYYKFEIGHTVDISGREYIIKDIQPNIYRKKLDSAKYDFLVTVCAKNDLHFRMRAFASTIKKQNNATQH